MKRIILSWTMLAAAIIFVGGSARAASTTSVPMWNFSTTASRDGMTYNGTMLGRSPFFHGARTTNINTVLIPIILTINDTNNGTTVFDPTQPDPNCLPNGTASALSLTEQSPIFMPIDFSMNGVDIGSAQYIDAFQRANFYQVVNPTGDRYHTVLARIDTVPMVPVTLSSPDAATTNGNCGKIGVIDQSKFDAVVAPTLSFYHFSEATTLAVFLLYNVAMTNGSPDPSNPLSSPSCCLLGYHRAAAAPDGPQLYAVADYDSSGNFQSGTRIDIAPLARELGDLFDDPFSDFDVSAKNPTPAWGTSPNCQDTLLDANPLNTLFPAVTMPNGVTYHPPELAFFSWFFGAPSIGAGGEFSNHGTFHTDAGAICE